MVGEVPQPQVVLLAAGEVLEHGPQRAGLARPQVYLYARVQHHAGLAGAVHQRFPHLRQRGQRRANSLRVRRYAYQVKVADGLFPTAKAAGRHEMLDSAAPLLQRGPYLFGQRKGLAYGSPLVPVGLRLDVAQQRVGSLLPHPRQGCYASVPDGRLQVRNAGDAQLPGYQRRRLGADAWYGHQVQDALGDFGAKFFVGGDLPGKVKLPHLVADGFANARNGLQVHPVVHCLGQRERKVLDGASGPLVGAYLEYGVPLQFQEDRHVFEQLRCFFVTDRHYS